MSIYNKITPKTLEIFLLSIMIIFLGACYKSKPELSEDDLKTIIETLIKNEYSTNEVIKKLGSPSLKDPIDGNCENWYYIIRRAVGPGREVTGMNIVFCNNQVKAVNPTYGITW